MNTIRRLFVNKDNIETFSQQILKLDETSLKQVSDLVYRLGNINQNTQRGKTLWYNFRYDFDKTLWEPKLKNTIESYRKNCISKLKNPEFDLIYRSRYSDKVNIESNGFINVYEYDNQSVVISDYIMFNKNYKLKFLDLDRLLPYCKFKNIDHEHYQIDGWIYRSIGMYQSGSNQSNKIISWDMANYHKMDLLKTEEEKRLCVRAMLQIMNECDEEQINLYNYNVIGEWYNYYDSKLNSYNSNQNYNYQDKNKIIDIDPKLLEKVEINGLLTPQQVLEILYIHAVNGSNDKYIMFKQRPEKLDIIAKPNVLIKNVQDSVINTVISDQCIDLSEYARINGNHRAKNVIDTITYAIKNKVNCFKYKKADGTNITASELVTAIYNYSEKFSMGNLDPTIKKLTVDDAKKILSKTNYIDYLDGKAFKMNFDDFPIVDIKKFEDRNGPNHFENCIRNYINLSCGYELK